MFDCYLSHRVRRRVLQWPQGKTNIANNDNYKGEVEQITIIIMIIIIIIIIMIVSFPSTVLTVFRQPLSIAIQNRKLSSRAPRPVRTLRILTARYASRGYDFSNCYVSHSASILLPTMTLRGTKGVPRKGV